MRNRIRTASAAIIGMAASVTTATTIWTGPSTTFTKPPGADWTLPQYQDQITNQVWVTRGPTQGIFNIAPGQEASYTHDLSPAGTEWAFGAAANWQSLTFENWETWAGDKPPNTVGQNAVLHLIANDIYLDIKFLSWSEGLRGGGGFSYARSTAPEPASIGLLALGGFTLLRRGRRIP